MFNFSRVIYRISRKIKENFDLEEIEQADAIFLKIFFGGLVHCRHQNIPFFSSNIRTLLIAKHAAEKLVR